LYERFLFSVFSIWRFKMRRKSVPTSPCVLRLPDDTLRRLRLWATIEGISMGRLVERELAEQLAQINVDAIPVPKTRRRANREQIEIKSA